MQEDDVNKKKDRTKRSRNFDYPKLRLPETIGIH
jgi:hypothetical protein